LDNKLQIHISSPNERVFLSDRWGGFHDNNQAVEDFLAEGGWSVADIDAILASHADLFDDEALFLVGFRPSLTNPKHRISLWMEFEFSDEILPQIDPFEVTAEKDAKAWRDALTLFVPSFLHTASGLRDISENEEAGLRCMLDFSAGSMGAMCVDIPLEQVRHSKQIYDLLFMNGIAFPPSSHVLIAAIEQIEWRYTQGSVPVQVLPGACRPYPLPDAA
jgi:hypothetical protein